LTRAKSKRKLSPFGARLPWARANFLVPAIGVRGFVWDYDVKDSENEMKTALIRAFLAFLAAAERALPAIAIVIVSFFLVFFTDQGKDLARSSITDFWAWIKLMIATFLVATTGVICSQHLILTKTKEVRNDEKLEEDIDDLLFISALFAWMVLSALLNIIILPLVSLNFLPNGW